MNILNHLHMTYSKILLFCSVSSFMLWQPAGAYMDTNAAVTNNICPNLYTDNNLAQQEITVLYYQLPENIQKKLQADNISIYACEDINSHFDNLNKPGLLGKTVIMNTGRKEIYICDKAIDKAFYHEIGHVINYQYDHLDQTNVFQALYHIECHNVPANTFDYFDSTYAETSSGEYFAEAFSLYLHDPNACQLYLPETYLFFEKHIT